MENNWKILNNKFKTKYKNKQNQKKVKENF